MVTRVTAPSSFTITCSKSMTTIVARIFLVPMAPRTIRCGRCRYEFIIGGVAETTCPQCGARNRIPGAPDAAPVETAGPLGETETAPPEAGPPPDGGPKWVVCPQCSYRFAVGDVETVSCPLCSTSVTV